jgi:hypothetical protein
MNESTTPNVFTKVQNSAKKVESTTSTMSNILNGIELAKNAENGYERMKGLQKLGSEIAAIVAMIAG